jgi:hypothetical protein
MTPSIGSSYNVRAAALLTRRHAFTPSRPRGFTSSGFARTPSSVCITAQTLSLRNQCTRRLPRWRQLFEGAIM